MRDSVLKNRVESDWQTWSWPPTSTCTQTRGYLQLKPHTWTHILIKHIQKNQIWGQRYSSFYDGFPIVRKPIEQHKGGWETTFLMKMMPSTELCFLGVDLSLCLWKKICTSLLGPSRWGDSAHGSSTEARMHQSFLQWWEGSEALVSSLGNTRPTQLLGRHNAGWIYNEVEYSSFIFYLWKCCCLWNHSIMA